MTPFLLAAAALPPVAVALLALCWWLCGTGDRSWAGEDE